MGAGSLMEIVKRKLSGKKTEFSEELQKFAVTLQYYSSKAYNFVRKQFSNILPHPRTISNWYQNISGEPGFTNESFQTLKQKVQEGNHVICNLVVDEMSIKDKLEFDGKKFHGLIDMGTDVVIDSDNVDHATNALVFLVKNKWIQAVKRKGSNNQLWEPNQNSRICCEHFFDGKPSKHPNSPSFYPTIFPKIYKQKVPAHQKDKLLLSLVKLKLGISFTSISIFFNLHWSTCSRIFKNVLKMLAVATKKIVFWPSKKPIISTLPQSFKQHYPNCRVIIDCTEIKTEQSPHVDQRAFMYSLYKSAYTCKFLVGIAPCGMITFVSKAYGGRASDSFITNDSGLLNLLEPGDQVMADKGFPGIKTSMDEKNSILVMPPFMHNGVFTEDEIIQTYNIASVRIHIERSIQRIKIYNILQKIPIELLECIDDIIFVSCVMTNLQPPIIKPNP
ncbi:uncharacterized protein LOC114122615 [Aphis gossypii]|uniref:uncharacterized protein LOC114122615 n=1 Tax=Aphis gossypii TaxID=80765 RepID=UPI002158B5D0|nr:uncharacterized protein LOC114122615 [Aphis gossypii]